jgi:hypothetical protein
MHLEIRNTRIIGGTPVKVAAAYPLIYKVSKKVAVTPLY